MNHSATNLEILKPFLAVDHRSAVRRWGMLLRMGLLAIATASSLAATENVVPLERTHAHNDYEHTRPLLDALDNGFCSVEADIHLVDGKLLVAHDRPKVKPERTLEALYLDPLQQRAKANGGRIYSGGPKTFTLLIDIKGNAEASYEALQKVLDRYDGLFSTYDGGKIVTNAVTAILSGSRPEKTVAAQINRKVFLDGFVSDLESGRTNTLVPLISDNWSLHFKWNGRGQLPPDEKQKLQSIVTRAHMQGRRVRFWGAPDFADFWKELHAAEVDLINSDDLPGLRGFLLDRGKR